MNRRELDLHLSLRHVAQRDHALASQSHRYLRPGDAVARRSDWPAARGYEKLVKFIRTPGALPSDWFVHEDAEFSPPLLILGTYYEIEAVTELDARTQAASRFASDLSRHKLPRPHDPINAEIADWA